MLRTRERSRGGNGSGGGAPVAAPLPAASTDNALFFGGAGGNTRYGGTDIGLPASDWSIGLEMNSPTVGSQSGFILSANVSNVVNGNNSFYIFYDKALGYLTAAGRDSAGNFFGQSSAGHASVNARGLRSRMHIPSGQTAKVTIGRFGGYSKMFVAFPGHEPVCVAECKCTFGSVTTNQLRLGADVGGSVHYKGILRNFYKVSYALSVDDMTKVGNGVDPATLGTPAANDFRFLLAASTNPIASTINGITFNVGSQSNTIVSGLDYAPMTEPVYLTSYGWKKVFQHGALGTADIPLSGRYLGAHGADIQVQVLDENNTAFLGWQTVATGVSGGIWSGSITIPKGLRWCKLQMRKVISGVPSTDVMLSSVLFAPGVTAKFDGQSSQDKGSSTGLPYGSSDIAPNNFISTIVNQSSAVSRSGVFQIAVTGVSNNGGFCQVQVGTDGHGLYEGQKIAHSGVGGTVELNAKVVTVTQVVDKRNYVVDVPFVNAWTSGGQIYDFHPLHKAFDETSGDITPDGMVVFANHLSSTHGCPVQVYNASVGGANIEQYNQWDNGSGTGVNVYGITGLLAGYAMGKVGVSLLQHGHANIGQAQYYSGVDGVTPGGTEGARTGFGAMGLYRDFYRTNLPNSSDMKFGCMTFPCIAGRTGTDAATTHSFRHGMDDCIRRMRSAGDLNAFVSGWRTDLQPQWENGTTQNSHLHPGTRGYYEQFARQAHATAYAFGSAANDSQGPVLLDGSRSGAVITLPVQHNGGTSLKYLTPGIISNAFEASLSTSFASLLTINNVTLTANSVIITLSADPAAPVYVRYLYGQPGNYATNTYMTPRVTNVVDNAGEIEIRCEVSPTPALTPASSQPAAGLTPLHGKWVTVEGVPGAIQANGTWQLNVLTSERAILVGSSSAGLGTFVAGSNLWQTNATGTVNVETCGQIYDDRTIGTYDPNGAPMVPTYTYVTAS